MPRRYDMRIPTAIRVKVRGTDENGNSFEQAASTINVSRTGARLDGVSLVRGVSTIELRRGWFRKARFRVVWAGMPGTTEANQVGLRLLDQDASFWGIPFPAPQILPSDPPAAAAAAGASANFNTPLPGKWDAPEHAPAPPSPFTSTMPPGFASAAENDLVALTWQAPVSSGSKTIRERVASVTIRFKTPAGEAREESCPAARVLRDKSCIIPMRTALREGDEVTIVNDRTHATRPAMVTMCGPQMPDGTYAVAIDLAAPDTAFCGSGSVH